MFCTVMVTVVPSAPGVCDTTSGTLMLVHLVTNTPMTNRPRIDAPSVSFCSRLPPMSLTILTPLRKPSCKPYHFMARRTALKIKKNNSGPRMFPDSASDAPSAAVIGRNVPQTNGSPTPASGPISPTLMPLMAPSSISAPLARASSIAAVTPITGPHTAGVVLKNTRWRLSAATWSSFSGYRRLMAGIMS